MSDHLAITLDCARFESALSTAPSVLSQADIEHRTGLSPARQVSVRRTLRRLHRIELIPTEHGFAYALTGGGEQ